MTNQITFTLVSWSIIESYFVTIFVQKYVQKYDVFGFLYPGLHPGYIYLTPSEYKIQLILKKGSSRKIYCIFNLLKHYFMKAIYLIIGIIIGGGLGYAATKFFENESKEKIVTQTEIPTTEKWEWPEDLDALKAAPDNHKVIYEDDNVRILAVILDGKESEPVHTHKWKSVMWIAKPIVPCQITNYKKDENGNLVKSDSILINEMPVDKGQLIPAEGPTSITNLGYDSGVAYRIEFKKEFAK